MAVNCLFKVCHLSNFQSLLEFFPSVSTSYANLRVFYLLPWISNFRSAAHEFSLSRCHRGIVAPKSIRSHFRCTLIVSVWSFLDYIWTIMCQFLHSRSVTTAISLTLGISLHPFACTMVIFLNSSFRSAAHDFSLSWCDGVIAALDAHSSYHYGQF